MKVILRNDSHKIKGLFLTGIFDACLENLMKNEIAGYQYTGLEEGLDNYHNVIPDGHLQCVLG